MTAYTETEAGFRIWVPQRSASLNKWPSALDTTVAGGVRAGESPLECIIHEAAEEASLPEQLIREKITAAGALTYVSQPKDGLDAGLIVPDVLYTFDVQLDNDTVPSPHDEEVKEFRLYTVDQIRQEMFQRKFKPNCALVMIDFFIRHGIISTENETDYLEIVQRLHRALPINTSRSQG